MEEVYNLLIKRIESSRVLKDEPMSKHTSFKIGGPADLFVKVKEIEELEHLLQVARERNVPATIIRKWQQCSC